MKENSSVAEDLILIKKTLRGEKESFRQLIDKYKNSIFKLAYYMMGNYSDAEDVSQEVFLQAYRKLKEFKIRFNFHTWLYTIGLNICKNKLKRRSILKFISIDKLILNRDDEIIRQIPDKSATIEETLIDKEEREKINVIFAGKDSIVWKK
ncbi:sigma-70 family RNA polymerase sigma factor [bacterium]|nr:sigma-70 family RNA polymerase sigma factor [bacterium]